MIAWLEKQGEQKPVLSEEDERHNNTIIRAIHGAGNITPIDGELAEKWLKSLRSQKQWKPTEEQMDALETAVSAIQSNTLETLYQDLKREKNYE